MKWEVKGEVKCTRDAKWVEMLIPDAASGGKRRGPKKDEVCLVESIHSRMTDNPLVDRLGYKLRGYEGIFTASCFSEIEEQD